MILKICGITNAEDAACAIGAGANAIGFNFYSRSPRFVTPEGAAAIETMAGVRRVGVFVNERPSRIAEVARIARLDVAQLHGDEANGDFPPAIAVWKAARVGEGFDLTCFDGCPAEALLLDAPAGELYGGSGKTFDWRVVSGAARRIILAGGLDASNVAEAVAALRPWGVDACSRLEREPGKKDLQKMIRFLTAAKAALLA